MIGMRVTSLNFNARPVITAKERAALRIHKRFGAFVRTAARSKLKRAKQQKISELTPGQKKSWEIDVEQWKRAGRRGPKPRRPEVRAEPGQPPKLHSRKSPLRELILFDATADNVVIGPKLFNPKFGTPGAGKLEYGTGGVREHPFMRPSFADEFPKLQEWRDSIRS